LKVVQTGLEKMQVHDSARLIMADLLKSLQDRQAVLLMYAVDELPAEDRAEVERMLQADPSLRAELASMRELHAQVTGGLDQLDLVEAALPEEMVTRRVVREMRRHQLELSVRPQSSPQLRRWRSMPWWTYPLASAAAIVFIVLGLWGVGILDWSPEASNPPTVVAQGVRTEDTDEDRDSQATQLVFSELQRSLGVTQTRLDEADNHINSLQQSEEDTLPTL